MLAACLSGALAPASRVLRAERFELVNAAGTAGGALGFDGTTPGLLLVSPENGSFVALTAGPSSITAQPGTAGFTMGLELPGRESASATAPHVESGPDAKPIRTGRAMLMLGAPSRLTMLVADEGSNEGSNYLLLDGNGPLAVLKAASSEEDGPGASVELVAETADSSGDYGHGSLTATTKDSRLLLGANDVDAVDLGYREGKPSLALQDAEEKIVFRAP